MMETTEVFTSLTVIFFPGSDSLIAEEHYKLFFPISF